MSNCTITNLYVTGRKFAVQQFLSECSENGIFKFQKVVPMPKELENTPVPTPFYEEIRRYQSSLVWPKKWKAERIAEAEKYLNLLKKYGVTNWLDWRINHWGTETELESDSYFDQRLSDNGWYCVCLVFHTERSWPHFIVDALRDKYYALNFFADVKREEDRVFSGFEFILEDLDEKRENAQTIISEADIALRMADDLLDTVHQALLVTPLSGDIRIGSDLMKTLVNPHMDNHRLALRTWIEVLLKSKQLIKRTESLIDLLDPDYEDELKAALDSAIFYRILAYKVLTQIDSLTEYGLTA